MLNQILQKDTDVILAAMGINDMPEQDKAEVLRQILKHLNQVIVETAIAEMNEEQIKEFSAAMDLPDWEEEVTAVCAHVPGLAEKIENAIEQEIQVLRAAKEKLS